jgi:hypothetical protein
MVRTRAARNLDRVSTTPATATVASKVSGKRDADAHAAPGPVFGHEFGGMALQRKCTCEDNRTLQRKAEASSGGLHSGLVPEISRSTGFTLSLPLRERASRVFNTSFTDVRLHADSASAQTAARIGARAFTIERDVYFGGGQYRPADPAGIELIGHELAHVVQQKSGLARTDLESGGERYEQEADRAGAAFAANRPVRIEASGGNERGIVQRSASPGGDAGRVGTPDSPHGLPFLGEANTMAELVQLMGELAAAEGATLGIVDESFAMAPGQTAPVAPLAMSWSLDRPAPSGKPIQRAVVAGCNVPGAPPNVIGMLAHQQIQSGCATTSPGCVGEFTIPGVGRADLVRQGIPRMPEIGEIKPASWIGRGWMPFAATQLATYLAGYQAAFGTAAVPMYSFAFSPGAFWGNPTQMLTAWGPASGLYFYRCLTPRPPRVRVPVRVPSPVPVVSPAPSTARNAIRTGAAVGAGIGVGYLIYRGVRLLPSLFPAAWPTIPANLAIP